MSEQKKPNQSTSQNNKSAETGKQTASDKAQPGKATTTNQANKGQKENTGSAMQGQDSHTPASKKATTQVSASSAKPTVAHEAGKKDTDSPSAKQNKPATQTTSAPQKPQSNKTSAQSDAPSGAKASPLALVISLIALGIGGYALYHTMQQPKADVTADVRALKSQITALQEQLGEKAEQAQLNTVQSSLETLQQRPQAEGGMDEAAVNQLISKQVQPLKKDLTATIDNVRNELAQAAEQRSEESTQGVSKDEVNTMIKDAVANISQGDGKPTVDFTAEMEAIKQDKAEIQKYVSSIQAQSAQIQDEVQQALSKVDEKIGSANDQPIVYPLITLLKLAEVAGESQQYGVAARYLAQAKSSFATLKLNQPPYADFADKIGQMAEQFQSLSADKREQKQWDGIINGIKDWPMVSTDAKNLLDTKENTKPTQGWKDELKHIGSSILSHTVTITKNDAAGITWVKDNPHLQQIVKENIRLDFVMIRNALLLGDQERAEAVAKSLQAAIQRYFDTQNSAVHQALEALQQLGHSEQDVPDIASLIQSIQQAG